MKPQPGQCHAACSRCMSPPQRPQFTDDAAWQAYAERLNAFGAHLKSRYGITLAYHHHMGAYVESPADIDKLMALTDPAQVGLLFDTGHAYFGGATDPAAVMRLLSSSGWTSRDRPKSLR